ncbi:hypothetical protein GGR52DRAFT_565525 [Hypoxylon sp. FL1284]|nr:hypothetical protein GGR52DRAFT_565525 [Hypoxylon sp. FL1284]
MSSLLPFLYQTRTILRASPRATAFARSLHGSRQLRKKDDIPFVSGFGGEGGESIELEDEDIPSEPARPGTITPSERQIFEGIFTEIKARGLKPTVKDNAQPSTPTSDSTRSTLSIMQSALRDAGQDTAGSAETPDTSDRTARDRKKALSRFPSDLRAAASIALDISGDPAAGPWKPDGRGHGAAAAVGPPSSAFANSSEIEAKRRPERIRIEGLISTARTDIELWNVLEKEVFTLPAQLGLETGTSNLVGPHAPRGADERGKMVERKRSPIEFQRLAIKPQAEESPGTEGQESSPQRLGIYIHGPLFPAYLLLALRRLDRGFHMSSPLVYSVLPRIKELGLEAYILGVSTPFYNELLHIYWSRHGDLFGMLQILDEMRQSGFYFDERTKAILRHVDWKIRDMAEKPVFGSFTRAVMEMPEYGRVMRAYFQEWYQAVDLALQKREQDSRRERSVGY